jgi:hypothetical protein
MTLRHRPFDGRTRRGPDFGVPAEFLFGDRVNWTGLSADWVGSSRWSQSAGSAGMTITQEVLDALPETGDIGRHLPALTLFSKADDPIDVESGDGRRYLVGWAGGIRYKRSPPAYWPIRFGAECAVAFRPRPTDH